MKSNTENNVWAVIFIAIVITVFGCGVKMLRDSNRNGMSDLEIKKMHLAKELRRNEEKIEKLVANNLTVIESTSTDILVDVDSLDDNALINKLVSIHELELKSQKDKLITSLNSLKSEGFELSDKYKDIIVMNQIDLEGEGRSYKITTTYNVLLKGESYISKDMLTKRELLEII